MLNEDQAALDAFLAERAGAQAAPAQEGGARGAPAEPVSADQAALNDFLERRRVEGATLDVADMVAENLQRADSRTRPRVTANVAPSDSVLGFVVRAARSTTFGLTDLIQAKLLQRELSRDIPDVTFQETLAAVRQAFDEDQSILADIAGSLVPGAIIAKGLGTAMRLAASEGVRQGVLRFAASRPKLARFLGAAGAGAGGGAVEEFIRASVDESLGSVAGDDFDPDRVVDATITGALVGGIFAGGLQTAARGVGPVPGVFDVFDRLVRDGLGASGVREQEAATRLFNALREGNEAPEEAALRLHTAAQEFLRENGRPPALSDLMRPEQVAEAADIVRFFAGLDRKAVTLADMSIDRAVQTLEDRLKSGVPIKSPERLSAQIEDSFARLMRNKGQTLVDVSDQVIEDLSPFQGWIAAQAKHNPAARKISEIMAARDGITKIRQRVGNLRNRRNAAEIKREVAELDTEINLLLSNPASESAARAEVAMEPSLGALRNLRNMLKVKADRIKADASATEIQQALDDMSRIQADMERALDDFRREGLKITLSDANALRAAASRYVNKSTDLAEQETARAVRDAVGPVGTREVPEYGRMVRVWRDVNTRIDAQDTGVAAATGTINLSDLKTRIMKGRLPSRSGRATGTAKAALEQGVREGAIGRLMDEVTGTRESAVAAGRRIAENRRVQAGLRLAAPGDADDLIAAGKSLAETNERARALAGPRSPSQAQADVEKLRDAIFGAGTGFIGNTAVAGFFARVLQNAKVSRGVAEKTIEMLGDPAQFDQAIKFMRSKGIDVGALAGAIIARQVGIGAEE